jgi:hypothetical protein
VARRSLGTLTLDLVAKIGGFQRGLDQASRLTENRARTIENSARRIGRGITAAFAAIGGAALVRQVIAASVEQENALRQLEQRIQSTGGAAGKSSKELTTFASELQKVTTFGDDAIVTAQGLLLAFTNIRGDNFDRATEAALDLSTALGTDLNSAAQLLGKALDTPAKGLSALSRAGVRLSEDQQKLIKRLSETGQVAQAQGLLLDGLAVRFGGAARAAADTLGGALQQVKNDFGELFEAPGGVEDAKESLQDFRDLLRDPSTVEASGALADGVIRSMTAIASAIRDTIALTKFLGEELASIRSGAAAGDLPRLEEDLETVEAMIRSRTVFGRLRFLGKDGLVEFYDEAELQAEMKRLKGLIEDSRRGTASPGAAPDAGTPAGAQGSAFAVPPSEEFEKLAKALEQQIALYGKTGEAARIAYQIQSGALDELSTAEQQQVLRLAQQYDALVASAAAAKELEEAQKKLAQAYESQVESYERQIALSGELSEVERIRYEIEQGSLEGITEARREYLLTLAEQVDLQKELAEGEQEWRKQLEEGKALTESLRTPLEEYGDEIERINELLRVGAIDQETYGRAVEKAQERLDEATNQWTVFKDQAARNTQDILADTLVNGFDEGVDGILDSFKRMIDQLVAQAIAADIAGKLFGKAGGGTGDGWLGKIFGGGGAGIVQGEWDWFGKVFGGIFGGGRAGGGPVEAGMLYRVNETRDEYFQPSSDGKIVPLADTGSRTQPQFVTNVNVRGNVDRRSAAQIAIESARRQNLALQRLG